jgi:BTB/POZ domain
LKRQIDLTLSAGHHNNNKKASNLQPKTHTSMATAQAITIDVGGVLFRTTQSTLCSRGGMLAAMFSPDSAFSFTKSSASDSTPFIDRDGELFKCAAVLEKWCAGSA